MKRRSSTNAPHDHVFFTDRDLGRGFPVALAAAGISVERHDDHFTPQTTDIEWLTFVGRRRWIVLTHNSRIRYTPLELDCLMRCGVRCLVLIGKAPLPDLAQSFIGHRQRVVRFLGHHPGPFIAKVYRRLRRPVELWLSHAAWLGERR